MTTERTEIVDQADPKRGRIDRERLGRDNPADAEPRPANSVADIEATRDELAELRRRLARKAS